MDECRIKMFEESSIASDILKNHVVAKAIEEAKKRPSRLKENFSPSMDFLCPTKTFFNFKFSGGNALEIDARDYSYEGTRALYNGNKFHEYVQQQFEESGTLVMQEQTLFDEEYHIKARLDMVIEVKKVLYLVELKSAKAYSLKLMHDACSPDMEHQKQIQIYFHLLDHMKNNPQIYTHLQGRSINKGLILYENKDNHKLTEYVVNRNPAVIREALEFARVVWKKIQDDKEPTQKFEADSPECLYKCNARYYQLCHGKANPKKEPIVDGHIWGFGSAKSNVDDPTFI
jgi:hypothetical protein